MDSTNLHLMLNHFPILGTLFGFCLLAYGLVKKDRSLEHAGLTTLVIITLLAIPVFLSGEGAEHDVEHLPGVSEHFLEEHEELAEVAIWLMAATGALALLTLIMSIIKGKRSMILKVLTTVVALVTFTIMVGVGSYGGKIRHSELRGEPDQTELGTGEHE